MQLITFWIAYRGLDEFAVGGWVTSRLGDLRSARCVGRETAPQRDETAPQRDETAPQRDETAPQRDETASRQGREVAAPLGCPLYVCRC